MSKLISLFLIFTLIFSACSDTKTPVTPEEMPKDEPFRSVVAAPEYFYEFRKDVVKYSSIDPESDFAKTAVDFVRAYLEKQFSENEEIESFEITDIEIDMNGTNWQINANLYGESLKNEDILNNFLVIRHRPNIKMKEGLDSYWSFPDEDFSKPIEGHYYVIYDPEDKYDYSALEGYDWKVWNLNWWSWNNNIHTEEEMFDVFYARKNEYLPIYTNLQENDKLAVLAVEYVKENLNNTLKNNPDIFIYEILYIEANINHTNWYINTLQYPNCTVNNLENHVICVSYKILENSTIFESNVYLLYDCGEWIELDSSKYSIDAFDDLTEEQLIGAISSMH